MLVGEQRGADALYPPNPPEAPMGDVIPMRDHAATRDALDGRADSPWFQPSPWEACDGCEMRAICREVRECHAPTVDVRPRFDDGDPVALRLRSLEIPDIIA